MDQTAEKNIFWLETDKEILFALNKALGGFNELPFAIQIFGGPMDKYRDIDPWHHLLFEAEQDLDSAILLLLMGFYKDSLRSLRSFLELHIFALYHFTIEDTEGFQNWLHGKANTPKFSELLQTLSKTNERTRILNEKLKWNIEIESLYKELSCFMHTRGALHTHTALRNSNMTSFSETGIKTGVEFLLKTIRLVSMGFVVNFPMSFQSVPLFDKFAFHQPAGGFLENDQVERVKHIFPDNICNELSKICSLDDDSNSLADAIRSMPDLSEKEIFESLMKTLESSEFAHSKKEILQMIKNDDFDKAFSYVRATQRAMIRAMTMALFNPFHTSHES